MCITKHVSLIFSAFHLVYKDDLSMKTIQCGWLGGPYREAWLIHIEFFLVIKKVTTWGTDKIRYICTSMFVMKHLSLSNLIFWRILESFNWEPTCTIYDLAKSFPFLDKCFHVFISSRKALSEQMPYDAELYCTFMVLSNWRVLFCVPSLNIQIFKKKKFFHDF